MYPTNLNPADPYRTQGATPGEPGWLRPKTPQHVWETQPAVRTVVGFLAEQLAGVPMVLLQQAGENDTRTIRDGEAHRVLRKPSPLMTSYMLWRDVMVDRLTYDVALVLYMDGELVRIPPHMFQILSDAAGIVRQIRVQPPGGDAFDAIDLPRVLLYGWHPDSAGGVSPLHTLAAILDESERSVEWRARQWENGPKLSGFLKRPAEARRWDAEQKERFQESWRAWSSNEVAGGTPILENGMQYEQLKDLTPLDAQDIEGRQLTAVQVATFFGVPPELLGIRAGNFAGLDAHRKSLYGSVLGPHCAEIEQAFNAQLLPRLDTREGVALKFDRDGVAAGSLLEKAKTFQVLTGAPVMTRAEARDALNLPHLAGTDELVVPMNLDDGGGN